MASNKHWARRLHLHTVHVQIVHSSQFSIFLLIKMVIELIFFRMKVNIFVKKDLYELRVGSLCSEMGAVKLLPCLFTISVFPLDWGAECGKQPGVGTKWAHQGQRNRREPQYYWGPEEWDGSHSFQRWASSPITSLRGRQLTQLPRAQAQIRYGACP